MIRSPMRSTASLLATATLLAGCGSRDEGPPPERSQLGLVTVATLPSYSGESWGGFSPVATSESGVDHRNPLDTDHPLSRLYAFGYACGGVAIGDVNGDGKPDLYFSGGPVENSLFLQTGELTFERARGSQAVAGGDDWGSGAAMVDIDGDGDLDIYQCNYDAPNALYVNGGDATFTERAAEFGLAHTDASLMATFCDYDRDGDLDLYLLTNAFAREGGQPGDGIVRSGGEPFMKAEYKKWYDVRYAGISGGNVKHEIYPVGQRNRLFRNDGDSGFTDVSDRAGDIAALPGKGLSASWFDYNGDGWTDLYVGNDFEDPDHLYQNIGPIPDGRVVFHDKIKTAFPHTTWYSMGSDVADVNNDGLLDLFSVDMAATTHFKQKASMGDMGSKAHFMVTAEPRQLMRNALLINTGTGRFTEAAYLAGLAYSDWSWAPKLADFDNDGRVDAFVSNGMSRPFTHSDTIKSLPATARFGKTDWELFQHLPEQREKNLAFRNLGGLEFEDVSAAWGLDHEGMTYSAAYGDLDRDGDLDLVTANLGETVSVYRNNTEAGHRVLVELRGAQGNPYGLGAEVRIETASGTQVRQQNPMTGFMSSNDPLLHFGLGDDPEIDRMTVRWPGGATQEFTDLDADRHYAVEEPRGPAPAPPPPSAPAADTLFVASDSLGEVVHRDTPYNDFYEQPLLPNKLSQFGPALAAGDIDGDGDADLFLGGGSGSPGALLINDGRGKFGPPQAGPFEAAAAGDDTDAVLFDADGDGDLDLYVVGGGAEAEETLRDHLYLNAGGSFSPAPLPDFRDSGSCVAAADFDADGDVDLFVGSRSVPGQYPLAPTSRLLINDGMAGFDDASDTLAPGLAAGGMVTDAVWSDADGDGAIDLLVAYDWGPVRFFKNQDGKLTDATAGSGLGDHLGWWTAIAAGDVDNDGDDDFAVLNFGLNTKYHASPDKPALVYHGDFAGDGGARIVEAEFEGDILFPGRGKSCSTQAIPSLADKFATFNSFAAASLEEVYSPDSLGAATKFTATTLESSLIINQGGGKFIVRPLPRIAQISPGSDAVFTDVDGDGSLDLYIVQNFFGPQIETGRMDGGISQLFKGDGEGGFVPVPARESGLVVPDDAKSVVAADLDGDDKTDFAIGSNNGPLRAFLRR